MDTTDDTVLEGREALNEYTSEFRSDLNEFLDYLLADGFWIVGAFFTVLSLYFLWGKISE